MPRGQSPPGRGFRETRDANRGDAFGDSFPFDGLPFDCNRRGAVRQGQVTGVRRIVSTPGPGQPPRQRFFRASMRRWYTGQSSPARPGAKSRNTNISRALRPVSRMNTPVTSAASAP